MDNQVGGGTAGAIVAAPTLARVSRWARAVAQYNLGRPERLARLEALLEAHPGLGLAGNGFEGTGIPDFIRSGELAAEKLLDYVSNSRIPSRDIFR